MADYNPTVITESDIKKIFTEIHCISNHCYVYKAIDVRSQTTVIIKVIDADEYALNTMLCNHYTLPHSPFLIRYKEVFKIEKDIWMIMDYCDLGSVADIQQATNSTLEEYQIKIIIKDVLCALHTLHSQNVIYRQIRASNIMLQTNNHQNTQLLVDAYISSFNISIPLELSQFVSRFLHIPIITKLGALDRDPEYNRTDTGTGIGSPYWLAPEVICTDTCSAKADIWSLGITAMEMATGRPPHADKPPLQVLLCIPRWDPPSLPTTGEYGDKWSDDFRDFVSLCCTKDVEKRPHAAELLKHPWIIHHGSNGDIYEWIVNVQNAYALEHSWDPVELYIASHSDTDNDNDSLCATVVFTPDLEWKTKYTILVEGYIRLYKDLDIPEDIVTLFVMFFELLYIKEEETESESWSYGTMVRPSGYIPAPQSETESDDDDEYQYGTMVMYNADTE